MKIRFIAFGKTTPSFLAEGVKEYEKRLVHYINVELRIIPDIKNAKNLSEPQQKKLEGELILKAAADCDCIILLDENGTLMASTGYADFIEKKILEGTRTLCFISGGPFGFSEEVYKVANSKLSLSPMTFSHQMVKLIFLEQLYRAFTILKGEPYHHQ
jgi:Uncharacterized conserved protein